MRNENGQIRKGLLALIVVFAAALTWAASELVITYTIAYDGANVDLDFVGTATLDQTGVDATMYTASIGTDAEDIVFPTDIGTEGVIGIKNMDDTNFIELGFTAAVDTNFYSVAKLKAGESLLIRASGDTNVTYQLKADTAACIATIFVAED